MVAVKPSAVKPGAELVTLRSELMPVFSVIAPELASMLE